MNFSKISQTILRPFPCDADSSDDFTPTCLLCNLFVIRKSYTHGKVDGVAVTVMEYGPHFDQNVYSVGIQLYSVGIQ